MKKLGWLTATSWNFKTNLSYLLVKNLRYNIHSDSPVWRYANFSKLMRTIHISMTSTFQCEYCQCFTFKRCDKVKLKCSSHGGMYSAHYFGKISITSKIVNVVTQIFVEVLTSFYGRFFVEVGQFIKYTPSTLSLHLGSLFFSFIDPASSGSKPVYRKLFPHGPHSSKNNFFEIKISQRRDWETPSLFYYGSWWPTIVA